MMLRAVVVTIACLIAAPAGAQEETLDVLDGETLYEGGSLVTASESLQVRERLRDGSDTVDDPLHAREWRQEAALAWHYGPRHDLQLSLIAPYVWNARQEHTATGEHTLHSEGIGDLLGLAKWRFFRWDAPGVAFNAAVIGGLEAPSGSPRESEDGIRLDADLQPGSGSWDPLVAIAATHEPGRWRFNAFLLYQQNLRGETGYEHGDEFVAELAAGNRFWLEPYPGPFMRFDAMLRFRHSGFDHSDGDRVEDSGGDAITWGVNLAFRPRPSLDLQLAFETPIYEFVYGTQLGVEYSIALNLGIRF